MSFTPNHHYAKSKTDTPSHAHNAARDVLPLCTYRLFVSGVLPGVAPELCAH